MVMITARRRVYGPNRRQGRDELIQISSFSYLFLVGSIAPDVLATIHKGIKYCATRE